ncbi:hypothetical protein R6Q59_001547 [Mikania micrantha]
MNRSVLWFHTLPIFFLSLTRKCLYSFHGFTLFDHSPSRKGKCIGNYYSGRCGQPKKGHVCNVSNPLVTDTNAAITPAESSISSAGTTVIADTDSPVCVTPTELLVGGDKEVAAGVIVAKVCTGWRNVTRRLWKAAEELRHRVPVNTQVGFVGSVLQKSPTLGKLTYDAKVRKTDLRFCGQISHMDSSMLPCIAFACPNLESLEIHMCEGSISRIIRYSGILTDLLIWCDLLYKANSLLLSLNVETLIGFWDVNPF